MENLEGKWLKTHMSLQPHVRSRNDSRLCAQGLHPAVSWECHGAGHCSGSSGVIGKGSNFQYYLPPELASLHSRCRSFGAQASHEGLVVLLLIPSHAACLEL